MAPRSQLVYAGDDPELAALLSARCRAHDWRLSVYGQAADFVNHLRRNWPAAGSSDGTSGLQRLDECLTPVVLDLDSTRPHSLEMIRTIKAIDMAIPVIAVGRNVPLAAFSVARVDGAEALFLKPLHDLDSLVQAIQACLDKAARWRDCLRRFREPALRTISSEGQR